MIFTTLTVCNAKQKVIYQQLWNNRSKPTEISNTVGKDWYNIYKNKTAMVLVSKSKKRNELGLFDFTPTAGAERLDVYGGINFVPSQDSINGSVWLPFGSSGLNAIRHDFAKPYPTTGTLKVSIWAGKPENLRQKGVWLLLYKKEMM